MRTTSEFASTIGWFVPVLIAFSYICINSLINEPNRQRFNTIIVAGAGAAYLSGGGFGLWEMAFCAVLTACAFLGLRSYSYIGVGWLLHSGWDILHQLYGNPLLPFNRTSSLGCAICDPVLALWFLTGAPSVLGVISRHDADPST
jgi:hypothetical protein